MNDLDPVNVGDADPEHKVIQDRAFLQLSMAFGDRSPDPSTRVGAVIVAKDNAGLKAAAGACNEFPLGVAVTQERLENRDLKLQLILHAEMNAVLSAARHGWTLEGGTLYTTAVCAATGEVWGSLPCARCAVELIQAGIKRVVAPAVAKTPPRWKDSVNLGQALLREAGVEICEIEL